MELYEFNKYFGKHNGYDKYKDSAIQLLKETIEILNEFCIDYFLISGTLLGCIRHNDIMQWDDDIDLIIDNKILAVYDEIVEKYRDNIIFAKKDNWIIKTCFKREILHIPHEKQCSEFSEKYNFPYIDLFLFGYDNDKKNIFFFNKSWDVTYFFPYRIVEFCGINVSIPYDPYKFLSINYGDTYISSVVSKNWCHKTESGIDDIKTISFLDYTKYANKPSLLMNFELYNMKNNIAIPQSFNNHGINVGIVLAGGFSSRFNSSTMKQLFCINGKKIIEYTIDAMEKLDNIIIVTNDKCFYEINELFCSNNKIILLNNNIDCRTESLHIALEYIKTNFHTNNIVIHDVARPYIKKNHIENILKECENGIVYSQYCLNLTNGLIKINKGIEFVDRNEYIETCTPICINYELAMFIYKHYFDVNNRITCEFLPIVDIMKLQYKLLFGNNNFLKKITVIDDI
ncbi:2-C-methyl-D-erythritol 4-phosphate cytidylyltransferase [Bodo saltans virus]|uniref:2-C-methyl-D-erythritol 4-phosphate cytidylyltransferase n=1 Tax=Bodo saltans virus TaxID=2024608 RepID=A0A2H4UTB4_9VIRU|nr:2-C-methyl-D-erythritol 4-phosphate cytidylyltransferase [Bodo saltans virus]ATZ80180.1 2-C-methyl-D-erythritol 4-phosphate cytidylyltransferase [Bodo saltans virus]